jgi:hypothetical protein
MRFILRLEINVDIFYFPSDVFLGYMFIQVDKLFIDSYFISFLSSSHPIALSSFTTLVINRIMVDL